MSNFSSSRDVLRVNLSTMSSEHWSIIPNISFNLEEENAGDNVFLHRKKSDLKPDDVLSF